MGFNIGVWSDQTDDNHDCDKFINRTFYSFVMSGDRFGDQSILIQSGRYYGLDLSPLQKVVYPGEGEEDYDPDHTNDHTQDSIQNLDTLLELVTRFRNGIAQDPTVCDNISYTSHEDLASIIGKLENERENFIKEAGAEKTKQLFDWLRKDQKEKEKEIAENPNPWKPYFDEGQILEDLDNLLASLHCYKSKGVTEVYLTAG
jgi:hypothetical protein